MSQEERNKKRMSQEEQPTMPTSGGDQECRGAIRYGDVFPVGGELAGTPIAPQDVATMQAAENAVLGQTPKGGPAAVMQSAAARNERLGAVAHGEATDAAAEHGFTVSETSVPGSRIVTEFVADQHVGQYVVVEEAAAGATTRGGGGSAAVADGTKITIGEALEATAFSAGDQPVEPSDATAIEAAEARAAGMTAAPPGGRASRARAAADANALAERDEDKTRLRDVLVDATVALGADKEVEREDAARVVGAEVRSKPNATARPAGRGGRVRRRGGAAQPREPVASRSMIDPTLIPTAKLDQRSLVVVRLLVQHMLARIIGAF